MCGAERDVDSGKWCPYCSQEHVPGRGDLAQTIHQVS